MIRYDWYRVAPAQLGNFLKSLSRYEILWDQSTNIWPAFFRFLQQSMLPDSSFTAYRLQPLQMEVWDAKRTVVSFCEFPGEVWNWWKMLMSHLYSFDFICIHLYSFVFICAFRKEQVAYAP